MTVRVNQMFINVIVQPFGHYYTVHLVLFMISNCWLVLHAVLQFWSTTKMPPTPNWTICFFPFIIYFEEAHTLTFVLLLQKKNETQFSVLLLYSQNTFHQTHNVLPSTPPLLQWSWLSLWISILLCKYPESSFPWSCGKIWTLSLKTPTTSACFPLSLPSLSLSSVKPIFSVLQHLNGFSKEVDCCFPSQESEVFMTSSVSLREVDS